VALDCRLAPAFWRSWPAPAMVLLHAPRARQTRTMAAWCRVFMRAIRSKRLRGSVHDGVRREALG
jgi:hypothetical protein